MSAIWIKCGEIGSRAMNGDSTATWVGAVATTAAVIVALYVPRIQRKYDTQERLQSAHQAVRRLCAALKPVTKLTLELLKDMESHITRLENPTTFGSLPIYKVRLSAAESLKLDHTLLQLLPPEDQIIFSSAAGWVTSWNAIVNAFACDARGMTTVTPVAAVEMLKRSLEPTRNAIDAVDKWIAEKGSRT